MLSIPIIIIALVGRWLVLVKNKIGFIVDFISCVLFAVYYIYVGIYPLLLLVVVYGMLSLITFFTWNSSKKIKQYGSFPCGDWVH